MEETRRPSNRRIARRAPKIESKEQKQSGRRTTIIASFGFLLVITIGIIVGLYFSTWKNLWRPIITVNDETINMDYLIRRMKYFDKTDDVIAMLHEVIPSEILIRQGAPRYGIEVTQDEIDEKLRYIARGQNETISESEFRAWYRNRLNETRLSDTEYLEWIRTGILAEHLNEYLMENIPTVAEQIHLYIIVLPSYDDAETVINRLDEGEDFSEIARELSLDSETSKQGGDAGWWPEGGGLEKNLERIAFNLEVGQVSNPTLVDLDGERYVIFMVTERQPTREIERDKLKVLKTRALQEWLSTEWENSTVYFGGMDWSESEQRYVLGSETMAWIMLHLAKE